MPQSETKKGGDKKSNVAKIKKHFLRFDRNKIKPGSQEVAEIWEESESRREELRGLFAFGILASIFAAYQVRPLIKEYPGN